MRKEQTKLFTAQKMPCNFEAENALDDFAVGTMVGEPRGGTKGDEYGNVSQTLGFAYLKPTI